MTESAVLALGLGLAIMGILWIRYLFSPRDILRGEAKWRYRDRTVTERLVSSAPPDIDQTRGWWITRIEFGIAITAVLVGAVWLLAFRPGPMFHEPNPIAAGILPYVAFAGMLFGLAWMVRIYRAGLRNDAKATWRYRDRQS